MSPPSRLARLSLALSAMALGWSVGHLTSGRIQTRSHVSEIARIAGNELTGILADERYSRVPDVLKRYIPAKRVVALAWIAKDGTPRHSVGKPVDGLVPPEKGGVYQGRNLVAWVRLPARDWMRLEMKAQEPSLWFPLFAALGFLAAWINMAREAKTEVSSKKGLESVPKKL